LESSGINNIDFDRNLCKYLLGKIELYNESYIEYFIYKYIELQENINIDTSFEKTYVELLNFIEFLFPFYKKTLGSNTNTNTNTNKYLILCIFLFQKYIYNKYVENNEIFKLTLFIDDNLKIDYNNIYLSIYFKNINIKNYKLDLYHNYKKNLNNIKVELNKSNNKISLKNKKIIDKNLFNYIFEFLNKLTEKNIIVPDELNNLNLIDIFYNTIPNKIFFKKNFYLYIKYKKDYFSFGRKNINFIKNNNNTLEKYGNLFISSRYIYDKYINNIKNYYYKYHCNYILIYEFESYILVIKLNKFINIIKYNLFEKEDFNKFINLNDLSINIEAINKDKLSSLKNYFYNKIDKNIDIELNKNNKIDKNIDIELNKNIISFPLETFYNLEYEILVYNILKKYINDFEITNLYVSLNFVKIYVFNNIDFNHLGKFIDSIDNIIEDLHYLINMFVTINSELDILSKNKNIIILNFDNFKGPKNFNLNYFNFILRNKNVFKNNSNSNFFKNSIFISKNEILPKKLLDLIYVLNSYKNFSNVKDIDDILNNFYKLEKSRLSKFFKS
jgi:hypothetical protein